MLHDRAALIAALRSDRCETWTAAFCPAMTLLEEQFDAEVRVEETARWFHFRCQVRLNACTVPRQVADITALGQETATRYALALALESL